METTVLKCEKYETKILQKRDNVSFAVDGGCRYHEASGSKTTLLNCIYNHAVKRTILQR